jgi:tRNA uridine 5-carboxymethylaminomethyl modification enzyme
LEPEGWRTNEVYVQGMNTSLPDDVQSAMLRSIPGLEHVELMRTGYAVEYDCVPSDQLTPWLEAKVVVGLFLAGQINGTSGYEEAAAQGIMAGINAALCGSGEPPFVLRRDEAYIGVLIDDLVTQSPAEPYRLHTSRAEHRLLLRHDNADLRLTRYGYRFGMIDPDRYQAVEARRGLADEAERRLFATVITPTREVERRAEEAGLGAVTQPTTAAQLLRRAHATYAQVRGVAQSGGAELPALDDGTAAEVELRAKYAGYVRKERQSVARALRLEETTLPKNLDFTSLTGIRVEARLNLARVQPRTVGQAARVQGVTPADIAVLLVHLERGRRAGARR